MIPTLIQQARNSDARLKLCCDVIALDLRTVHATLA